MVPTQRYNLSKCGQKTDLLDPSMTLLKNGQLHCPFLCPFYRKTGPFFDSRIQKSLEVFFMTFSFENLVSGQSKDNLIVRTTKCP